jgi:hypothetical protein
LIFFKVDSREMDEARRKQPRSTFSDRPPSPARDIKNEDGEEDENDENDKRRGTRNDDKKEKDKCGEFISK